MIEFVIPCLILAILALAAYFIFRKKSVTTSPKGPTATVLPFRVPRRLSEGDQVKVLSRTHGRIRRYAEVVELFGDGRAKLRSDTGSNKPFVRSTRNLALAA